MITKTLFKVPKICSINFLIENGTFPKIHPIRHSHPSLRLSFKVYISQPEPFVDQFDQFLYQVKNNKPFFCVLGPIKSFGPSRWRAGSFIFPSAIIEAGANPSGNH